MAELPLDQAVPRFKANEDRLDTFVNSATGYTTSGGTSVQSIQQFLASIGSNGIDFVDNAKARFGTGNDLEIYHSGSGSFIRDTGTGDLTIDGSAISIQTASAERVSVSASGIDVTGTVEFDGLSGTGAVTITDIADEDNMASNSATKLATQQSIKAYVDAQVGTADTLSEVLGLGNTTGGTDIAVSANDDITFTDSSKAIFGAGSDLQIFHDASHSYIKDSGTGNLKLETTGGNISLLGGTENMVVATKDGSVSAYHNGSKKLETTSTGIDVTGNIVGDGLTIAGDATFTGGGTGSIVINDEDSSLCPTMTFTRNGGGTTTNDFIKFENSGGEVATINSTGGAFLSALNVTGTVEFDGLSGTGSVTVTDILDEDDMTSDSATALATQQSIKAYVDANAGGGGLPTTGGTMTGTLNMGAQIIDNVEDIYLKDRLVHHGDSNNYFEFDTDIQYFVTNGSEKMRIDSGGIDVTGAIDVATSGASNTSKGLAIATSGTNFESDGGIISIDHAASGAVTGGYFSKYSAGGTLRHSIKGDGKGYFAGGIDVTGKIAVGDANTVADHELHIQSSSPTIRLEDTDGNKRFDITQSGNDTNFDFESNVIYKKADGTEVARIDTGGIDVTGATITTGTSGTTQWQAGSSANKLTIASYDNNIFYHKLSSGNSTSYQVGVEDNIPIYTITNNTIRTTLTNSGNFGIGSTNPTSLLHLAANAPYITFEDTDNNQDWQIQATAWFAIRDQTANAERMRIDSTGKVGIGTSTLNNNKAVIEGGVAATNGSSLALKTGGGTSGSVSDLAFYGTFVSHPDTGQRRTADITSGFSTANWGTEYLAFGVGTGGSNDSAVVTTERMRIDSSGRVGIGTTSPNHELHIESTSPTIRLVDTDGNNTVDFSQSGSATYIDFDNTVRFRNLANAERFRIDSNGVDVTGNLTVTSTIEVGSLTPNQDGAIEVGVIALGTPAISSTTDSTSLRNHIIFDNPNGAVGKINTLNSATSYLTSSDYRLKTDVQEMTGSINRVKALRPVNFEWVVDGTRVDGFLAHEAQEVVPEAVDGEKDAMRDQEYVESEATGDIYTPAVEATYETIQVELTPAVEAVYETVTIEISPAVEATYDEDGNELTPAIEAVTEEQEQLVTPAVDATYEEQQQELTPAVDEVIHSSDVVEPDTLEEGQLWRETTEKVMATRQVPDYQGIDQSKIVPLLTSALQDAIAKIEALETRLEALEA